MNERIEALIERHLPLAGLAAWCARLPDQTTASRCYSDWFKRPQIEQEVMPRLGLDPGDLDRQGIVPVRLCWVFDRARVYFAVRSDGASLAVFVENRSGMDGSPFDRLLEEFGQMTGG